MNILLMLAHSIEEYDQLRLLDGLGYNVFSLGGYIDPARPHEGKRPAADVKSFPELKAVVDALGTENNLEAAKRHVPEKILKWADTIICHHYEYNWLWPQFDRFKGKRVIWRTVGQSTTNNEQAAVPFLAKGLEIVRYSPREENIPGYAGADALIRFYKDPAEWHGWRGDDARVINITQHLMQRGNATNGQFWQLATRGLPATALGPGSNVVGGPGELSIEEMQEWLRAARVYLYTGTQPASYTLGLIEAMMTGIPVVSIGREWMQMLPYGPELFEAPDIVQNGHVTAQAAQQWLMYYLEDLEAARKQSDLTRARAISLFGKDTIAEAWKDYLG